MSFYLHRFAQVLSDIPEELLYNVGGTFLFVCKFDNAIAVIQIIAIYYYERALKVYQYCMLPQKEEQGRSKAVSEERFIRLDFASHYRPQLRFMLY